MIRQGQMWFAALAALASMWASAAPVDAQGIPRNIPRNELLILENPEGTIKNAGWFNIWAINANSQSNGLQQAAIDTLWYIDPDKGIDGVWDNSLASAKPVYNADFTEMRAKLRRGIFWSDGVEFSSADVKFTVDMMIKTPGMRWSAALSNTVASVEAPDRRDGDLQAQEAELALPCSIHGALERHLDRAEAHFREGRRSLEIRLRQTRSLSSYVLHSHDPDGKWYIWQRREDWQRTSLGRFGMPAPKYLAYIDPGPPDKRVIAQMNKELDVVHDIAPEGMFTLAKQNKTSKAWFKGFPYGHPDPTLPAAIFNTQLDMFKNKDVRWALALLIDIKAVSMASYRGAATISPIAVPPTGRHPEFYHQPMQEWLTSFEVDTGKRKIKPYDPTMAKQIADSLRPSMGDQIPTDPKEIASAFGTGWWKPDPQAATELLERAGFKKQGANWLMPDGKPFTIRVVVEGDTRPIMTRAGSMIVQAWRNFGIDAKVDVAQGTLLTRRGAGDFDVIMSWSVETWGGHQDLSFFMDSWHSAFVAEPGKPQPSRNWQRWSHPELDKIIETIRTIDFDDPRGIELGKDYVKLVTREMPIIPLMSYNVFTVADETYWTGFPTAENPYANPVTNWGNSRYMFVRIKPKS